MDNTIMVAVSVVMPVYNAERFLAEAIESILNQTFTDFEFIIVNDGSTDGSRDIISKYAETDKRIVVIDQQNQGIVAALNNGIEKAKAPLIARMDADDISLPHRLERQVEFMEQNGNIAACGAGVKFIDQNGKKGKVNNFPGYVSFFKLFFSYTNPVAHPTAILNMRIVRGITGKNIYNKTYQGAEDYDLWLKLAKHTIVQNLQDILLLYRVHGGNYTSSNSQRSRILKALICRLNYGYMPTVIKYIPVISYHSLKSIIDTDNRKEHANNAYSLFKILRLKNLEQE